MSEMSLKDAVALFERHGIKPSLVCNGVNFVREAAEVIARLENRSLDSGLDQDLGLKFKNVIKVGDLKDGDILMFTATNEFEVLQDTMARIKENIQKLCGKKVVLLLVGDGTDLSVLTGAERERLLKHLQEHEARESEDRIWDGFRDGDG